MSALGELVRKGYLVIADGQEELCAEYASYFEGKTTDELDALAKSFALCTWRTETG